MDQKQPEELKQVMLTLKAVSPLALHQRRATSQFVPTLDYLPGSAVRGAIADLYLGGDSQRANDDLFYRLFLSGESRFSDFLPIVPGQAELSKVFPASAMACKRFKNHELSSLSDALLRLELARSIGSRAPLEWGDWEACPTCVNLDYKENRDRLTPGVYMGIKLPRRVELRKRLVSGTSIERTTGGAAHSMLFSHQVIEESGLHDEVLFRGVIEFPASIYSELTQLLSNETRLAVGNGRTRGLGHLVVHGTLETPAAERAPITQRWQAFNQSAAELWRALGQEPQGYYFSLTLQSHLALQNEIGEPVLGEISPERMSLPLGVKRCRSMMHPALVPGWNAVLNLPKPDTWVIQRGSVLLFFLPGENDPAITQQRLAEIEAQGLGERTGEGFGRATACDPFHYTFLGQELKGALQ